MTFQVNMHTLLVTPLAKWDQAKLVRHHWHQPPHAPGWEGGCFVSNIDNIDHLYQRQHQVLRLDLKIFGPLLATSTFVCISVAAVSNIMLQIHILSRLSTVTHDMWFS